MNFILWKCNSFWGQLCLSGLFKIRFSGWFGSNGEINLV